MVGVKIEALVLKEITCLFMMHVQACYGNDNLGIERLRWGE